MELFVFSVWFSGNSIETSEFEWMLIVPLALSFVNSKLGSVNQVVMDVEFYIYRDS